MDDDLDQLLLSLKLPHLREVLDDHLARATAARPPYSDFLRQLFGEELHAQQVRYLGGRIERARLPERLARETYPWGRQPAAPKAKFLHLATLDFLADGTNVVFMGTTGVGKTVFASGILLKALLGGRRGLFVLAQDLFDDMFASLADHFTRKSLTRLGRSISWSSTRWATSTSDPSSPTSASS